MKRFALFLLLLAGCCTTKETQIQERIITAPPIVIRDTVRVPVPQFIPNPDCDTAAILTKYCNPVAEHKDTAGNYWKGRYNYAKGEFDLFVKTRSQEIRYIDTTLNVTYNKIDPSWYWRLWFGFKVAVGTIGVLVIVAIILYVLSRFQLIKLPF